MSEADPFALLAGRLGGQLRRATALAGGTARNTLLELETPEGRRSVFVRQPRYADAGDVLRGEAAALSELKRAGLPVPEPLWLDADGELLGGPGLALEHLQGETVYAAADPTALVGPLARQLAAIHATRVSAKLERLLRARGAETEARLLAPPEAPDLSIGEPGIRAALATVERPRRNAEGLLHGDFWPGNVLWESGAISGVVDWEDSLWGDPLYDLAVTRLDLLWAYGPQAVEPFTRAYAAAAPHVDLSGQPWFDLLVCLRPAGALSFWAAQWPALGRPDVTSRFMRETLACFRDAALAAYALLTR